MSQLPKTLQCQPNDDLNSMPGTHVGRREQTPGNSQLNSTGSHCMYALAYSVAFLSTFWIGCIWWSQCWVGEEKAILIFLMQADFSRQPRTQTQ